MKETFTKLIEEIFKVNPITHLYFVQFTSAIKITNSNIIYLSNGFRIDAIDGTGLIFKGKDDNLYFVDFQCIAKDSTSFNESMICRVTPDNVVYIKYDTFLTAWKEDVINIINDITTKIKAKYGPI